MKTTRLILIVYAVIFATCVGALAKSPTPATGADLADWEDFARDAWHNRAECRVVARDGTIIDLQENYLERDGEKKKCNWEVTRDWRRGVSKLAFLKSQYPHDRIGLFLVNEPKIDNAEILRCAAACREFEICFKTVDEWGVIR